MGILSDQDVTLAPTNGDTMQTGGNEPGPKSHLAKQRTPIRFICSLTFCLFAGNLCKVYCHFGAIRINIRTCLISNRVARLKRCLRGQCLSTLLRVTIGVLSSPVPPLQVLVNLHWSPQQIWPLPLVLHIFARKMLLEWITVITA